MWFDYIIWYEIIGGFVVGVGITAGLIFTGYVLLRIVYDWLFSIKPTFFDKCCGNDEDEEPY